MKKILIILALLAIATWLVILPGLIGLYLNRWLPVWLDEGSQASLSEQRIGWFSSAIELDGADWQLSARARHLPPTRAAWLELDGQLQPGWLDQPVDFNGSFGLSGASTLQLRSDQLAASTNPVISAGASALDLQQSAPGQVEARLNLAALSLNDALGNRLEPGDSRLALNWQRLNPAHSSLRLEVRLEEPPSGLLIRISPIAIEPARELIQGIEQLRLARPDTMDQQLALLTIAGAWQQLGEAGMVIELSELSLAAETRFAGRWVTAESLPLIRGAGQLEPLLDWAASLIGLSRGLSPEMAEREARAWLTSLVDRQWLAPEGEHFEFHFPAAP
jgi:hypothetical protein